MYTFFFLTCIIHSPFEILDLIVAFTPLYLTAPALSLSFVPWVSKSCYSFIHSFIPLFSPKEEPLARVNVIFYKYNLTTSECISSGFLFYFCCHRNNCHTIGNIANLQKMARSGHVNTDFLMRKWIYTLYASISSLLNCTDLQYTNKSTLLAFLITSFTSFLSLLMLLIFSKPFQVSLLGCCIYPLLLWALAAPNSQNTCLVRTSA